MSDADAALPVPPARPIPSSVGKLEKFVLQYANAEGVAVGRVRHWISFMMLSGLLEQESSKPNGPRFLVKGGVALELRLPKRARATDDLDVIVLGDDHDLVNALDRAMKASYHDCTFTRRIETRPLDDRAVRVWVQVAYKSQRWATIQVDLTQPDTTVASERVAAITLHQFGLNGPSYVRCLSLPYQIAQKLHGLTQQPHDGRTNDRFRDAVDLLLVRELVGSESLAPVRAACELTFRVRAAQPWPPSIVFPSSWNEPFARLCKQVGVHEDTLDVAAAVLREWTMRIASA